MDPNKFSYTLWRYPDAWGVFKNSGRCFFIHIYIYNLKLPSPSFQNSPVLGTCTFAMAKEGLLHQWPKFAIHLGRCGMQWFVLLYRLLLQYLLFMFHHFPHQNHLVHVQVQISHQNIFCCRSDTPAYWSRILHTCKRWSKYGKEGNVDRSGFSTMK